MLARRHTEPMLGLMHIARDTATKQVISTKEELGWGQTGCCSQLQELEGSDKIVRLVRTNRRMETGFRTKGTGRVSRRSAVELSGTLQVAWHSNPKLKAQALGK